jgi:predicted MPP superfamily phosphohydrolase
LVVHLSDVHIKTAQDAVLGRAEKIVDAVRNLDYDVGLCLLIVSGDVAQSGEPAQYEAALTFLDRIKENLSTALNGHKGAQVVTIVTPGNHDCSFPDDTEVRDGILELVVKDVDRFSKPSVVKICTAVQDAFFDFRDVAASACLSGGNTLYYDYLIESSGE